MVIYGDKYLTLLTGVLELSLHLWHVEAATEAAKERRELSPCSLTWFHRGPGSSPASRECRLQDVTLMYAKLNTSWKAAVTPKHAENVSNRQHEQSALQQHVLRLSTSLSAVRLRARNTAGSQAVKQRLVTADTHTPLKRYKRRAGTLRSAVRWPWRTNTKAGFHSPALQACLHLFCLTWAFS